MSASRPLRPDGKPMRALRALADTSSTGPATEYDVYRFCSGPDASRWVVESYHDALHTLVKRDLAVQCPRAHSRAQWYITDAGRALLSS